MGLTYIVYGGVLLFSTLLLYLSDKVSKSFERKLLITLSFFIILIVAAVRYNVGTDYQSYSYLFHAFQDGNAQGIETGYRLLNIFIYKLGFDFEWFVALLSFITYFIFYKSYPKEKAYIFHFLFICTLYLYSFSNFRSSLVYGIMLIATMNYIENKKIIPFFILLAVSFSFHESSVIYLLIPLLFSKPMRRLISSKYISEVILISLIFLALRPEILKEVFFYNPIAVYLKFSYYADHEKWGGDANIGTGLGVLASVLAPTIFIVFRRYLIAKDGRMIYIAILSLFYVFLIDLSLATAIAARVKLLFSFSNILIIYYLAIYLGKNNKFFILLPIILLNTLVYFKTIHDSNVVKFGDYDNAGIKVSPYITIFNKDESPRSAFYRL